MKTKQELDEIKNKNLSGMTNEKLINYKFELMNRANYASKSKKSGSEKDPIYRCKLFVRRRHRNLRGKSSSDLYIHGVFKTVTA